MDGDQYGNERQNVKKVVPVRNSWIICRSESYMGQVYYFNTETGEAVWNLSEAEIEKAKRLTKSLGNSKKVILENCPEPKGSPMDETNNGPFRNRNNVEQQSTPSRIYNKQIINNRFPKHTYPSQTYPSCNHMVPTCGCSNTGASIGLSIATPFNQNVMTVPQSHQIIISSAPIVGHSQTSPNVVYNNQKQDVFVHNSTVPLNKRRESENYNHSSQTNFRRRNNFVSKNKNNRFGQRWEGNSQRELHNNFRNNLDLRELLSFKRTQRKSVCNEETEDAEDNDRFMNSLDEQQTSTAQYKQTEENNEDLYNSDADNDWLEENLSFKDSKLNLDVTNLKKIANPQARTDCWYIAVDKTILLPHINFLNYLINSDDQCHLMVPQRVLVDLRAAAASSHSGRMPRLRRRARRAVDFVSQQLKARNADIGDDNTETEYDSDYLVNCCLNLVQLNYHVVLLSNNIELQHHKTTSEISIFTMKELKQFLSSETEDKESSPEPPLETPEPLMKVIIPNDFISMSNETMISKNKKTRSTIDAPLREKNFEPQRAEDSEIDNQNEIGRTVDKRTIDAEVQTEITPKVLEPKVLRLAVKDNLYINPASNTRDITIRTQSLNYSDETNNATHHNKTQTQIRLNRSRPQVSTNDIGATVETQNIIKQYKWRKRRNASSSQAKESTPATITSSDITTPKDNLETGPVFTESDKNGSEVATQLHQISFESLLQESRNNYIDGNIASSGTSSAVMVQSNKENIIIEETSTSGVISNTSNGNSECGSIAKVQLIANTSSDQPVNLRMYDVVDQAMEYYLKMRCDEWVARFVQIMEEVLQQVLYQYPPEEKSMPPPWTLHEATQCIKLRFSGYKDIEDATTRLSNVVYKLSDSKGKISMDLKPSEFMEMYSYGVYLVNTLQSVINNLQTGEEKCQDLQIAEEYLSELLNEIQNPNLDDSHNESFGDSPFETSATVSTISYPDTRSNKRHLDNDFTAVIKETDRQYKLRSRTKNTEQEKQVEQQNVKCAKKVESSFFASLNLQKRTADGTSKVNTNVQVSVSNDKDLPLKFQTISLGKNTEDEAVHTYAKNSKSCTQFEELLKNTPQPMNQSDYSANYEIRNNECDKYIDTSPCLEDDYCSNEPIVETNEIRDLNIETNSNHHKVMEFVKSFLYEVKDSFTRVKRFSEQTLNEFMASELSISRKKEIREKAEKAHHYVDSLRKSLNSIKDRESSESEDNMKSLFMKAGIENFDLMHKQYRDNIANCIETANVLLETVNVIINAVKS